ncbi:hypothetical protein V2675_11545 [Tenacibaculum maritimum]|uniref:hypothetical protein n=1 Tax=Tenacibaculum maritimum TaxID=107401 RepID=UPI00387737BE
MYLNRIYSEPLGLFKAVEFKNGLNFIHGIKDDDTPKESLNSIGKSTFLDLIDFTLLSSFTKTHNQRLYKAREIMSGYNIVLEFEVNKTTYIVKRNVDDPNNIEFGALDDNTSIYPIKELKRIFGNLIFKRNQYKGVFLPSKWFRKLNF